MKLEDLPEGEVVDEDEKRWLVARAKREVGKFGRAEVIEDAHRALDDPALRIYRKDVWVVYYPQDNKLMFSGLIVDDFATCCVTANGLHTEYRPDRPTPPPSLPVR